MTQTAKHPIPVSQYQIGDFRNFLYVVSDTDSKTAVLIDIHEGFEKILTELEQQNVKLSAILLTHTHWDHVMGLENLITLIPEIRVGLHRLDAHRLKKSVLEHPKIFYFEEGSQVPCGQWNLQVLHTPGHSAGGCCFWLKTALPEFESVLFTGDTLFVGDCGRTDLDTGDVRQMFDSLQRIRTLPPETRVYPGHAYHRDPWSTIEQELKRNAPLMAKSADELAALP